MKHQPIIEQADPGRRAPVALWLLDRALRSMLRKGTLAIRLPDGATTRVFTKQEFRLDASGQVKESPRGAVGGGRGGGSGGRGKGGGGGGGGARGGRGAKSRGGGVAGANPWAIAKGGMS